MACHNAFRKRLLQIINRVALMQRAERRCDSERAVACSSDAVAHRAIRLRENAPALSTRFLSRGERSGKAGRDQPRHDSRFYEVTHRKTSRAVYAPNVARVEPVWPHNDCFDVFGPDALRLTCAR